MCGVIGLICEKSREDLGKIAAELLKTLEYRGYDSTGAAFQGEGTAITLLKGVGAPSVLVDKLGIVKMGGQIICGQVRWATFGSVTENNSQPHEVKCKIHMYGAHNGNVTNCDYLKQWLTKEGHKVLSDNDGEMVVHTIEHFFAIEIKALSLIERDNFDLRRICMRKAIVEAGKHLSGSYAAIVVDPISRVLWAIKQGSSLYFGIGSDDIGGAFALASSDLSSVLKLTRVLIPLVEGEFIEYSANAYQVYSVKNGKSFTEALPLERSPIRSKLQASDMALSSQFSTYMEQEIAAQIETCRKVVAMYLNASNASQALTPYIAALSENEKVELKQAMTSLREECSDTAIKKMFFDFISLKTLQNLVRTIPIKIKQKFIVKSFDELFASLHSSEAAFFSDLLKIAQRDDDVFVIRLMDVFLEQEENIEYNKTVDKIVTHCLKAREGGKRVFILSCGSSFHAAKAGAMFFNEIAYTEIIPVLPGEFRGQYVKSLRDGDVILAVSQSGETKDLIDVINQVKQSGINITCIALVNNISSTLSLEKCEITLPLRCGPEVAVPATKSFMNQMVVFYCLAMRMAQDRIAKTSCDDKIKLLLQENIAKGVETLNKLPELLQTTLKSTENGIDKAAEILYLSPSIHILAMRMLAIAQEGALKIREVVLNHTEGFEGSEFKHGRNTILGFNTVIGPLHLERFFNTLSDDIEKMMVQSIKCDMPMQSLQKTIKSTLNSLFAQNSSLLVLSKNEQDFVKDNLDLPKLMQSLYDDYPLIYITGPDEHDINLAISQLNTHKIRGCKTVVIAEDNEALRQAAEKPPCDNDNYQSIYISLPKTSDHLLVMFTSTIVLQRLALKMSLLKGKYLDGHCVLNHGVHPDVPKNVSKSITVD